jgi:hypothetical protein
MIKLSELLNETKLNLGGKVNIIAKEKNDKNRFTKKYGNGPFTIVQFGKWKLDNRKMYLQKKDDDDWIEHEIDSDKFLYIKA